MTHSRDGNEANVPELPPKPDSETGEPRPPHAPKFHGPRQPLVKENDSGREQRARYEPRPPKGQGPVLVWYRASQRSAVFGSISAFVIVTVALGAMHIGQLQGFTTWYVWLAPLGTALVIYWLMKTHTVSAGAEWLMTDRRAWVRTYNLKEIRVKSTPSGNYVDMRDHDGRFVGIDLPTLQEDRDLWDLVYNGMLHSVVRGDAQANGAVRSLLGLPDSSQ